VEGHLEDIYYSNYKHRCELCSKCFNSKDIVDQHMFDSHGLSVRFVMTL
jgi:hypothetical protein